MQRKTAIAAATAISVSLLSATVGIGANLGALGFARPSVVTASAHVASNAPASGAIASRTEGHDRGEHDDGSRATGAAVAISRTAQQGGIQHD